MKYSSAPLPIQAKKLKTRFNINPQLDKIREYLKATNRDIDANTASSRVALARKGIARTNALLQTNNLYATKENAETQLLNQDNMNQQNVAARNVEMYNRWREGKSNFDNMLLEKHAENTSDLIRGLTIKWLPFLMKPVLLLPRFLQSLLHFCLLLLTSRHTPPEAARIRMPAGNPRYISFHIRTFPSPALLRYRFPKASRK